MFAKVATFYASRSIGIADGDIDERMRRNTKDTHLREPMLISTICANVTPDATRVYQQYGNILHVECISCTERVAIVTTGFSILRDPSRTSREAAGVRCFYHVTRVTRDCGRGG